jgi:hypothetical protein
MDPYYDKLHHIATSESCSDSLPDESYGIPEKRKLDIAYLFSFYAPKTYRYY